MGRRAHRRRDHPSLRVGSVRRVVPGRRLLASAALLVAAGAAFAGVTPPPGWEPIGWKTDAYEVRLAPGEGRAGTDCVVLRTVADPAEKSFAGVRQPLLAGPYRGASIRLRAWLRSEEITGRGGLYVRIDGKQHEMLAIDNMRYRAVKGSTPWRRYEIVLEVPEEAVEVAFGVYLWSRGTLWADDFTVERLASEPEPGSETGGAASGPPAGDDGSPPEVAPGGSSP